MSSRQERSVKTAHEMCLEQAAAYFDDLKITTENEKQVCLTYGFEKGIGSGLVIFRFMFIMDEIFRIAVFVKVLRYPHPFLKYKCKPLQKINQEIRDIVAEMFEIMYAADGVGLAANQVGLPFQLFVMNPTGNKEAKEEECVFINPVIVKKNGNVSDNEGCLSFPEIHADVVRSESIEVESISLSGEEQHFQWKSRLARIVQHEMDHLNGICFVERVTATAKIAIKSELDDLCTVFEGDQRLGFNSTEAAKREWEEYERRFCLSIPLQEDTAKRRGRLP